jgi:hypothetical protein
LFPTINPQDFESKFAYLGLGFVILLASQQNSQDLVAALFKVFFK